MAEEKLFENKVKRWFHSIGIYPAGFASEKMNVPMVGWYTKIWVGGFQKSGIPDLMACVNGRFVSIELKASNGRASPLQELNTSRINIAEGIGVFLYPEGFDDFRELITKIIEEPLKSVERKEIYK